MSDHMPPPLTALLRRCLADRHLTTGAKVLLAGLLCESARTGQLCHDAPLTEVAIMVGGGAAQRTHLSARLRALSALGYLTYTPGRGSTPSQIRLLTVDALPAQSA